MQKHNLFKTGIYRWLVVVFASLCLSPAAHAQSTPFSYINPEEYVIGGISVSGIQFIDQNIITNLSGLYLGDKITVPGESITEAIEKLWDQGLFSDIQITSTRIVDDKIFLNIHLQELPRISGIEIEGIRKGEEKDLMELVRLRVGSQATENILDNTKRLIKNHYISKAFLNADVQIYQQNDSIMSNGVRITIAVNKGDKVRISDITFKGNEALSDRKLRRAMKKTKRRDINIFKSSKFIDKEYQEDMISLANYYNKYGYRDATVVGDSIYTINEKRIGIQITVDEGPQYYFRDIKWVGNSKMPGDMLEHILGIKTGDVYDKELLEERLFIDDNSISTIYMDDGYLFFNVEPVETRVANDSIDLEMRIFEGPQATINNVTILGNTKTHENVIRRELFSKPGDLFSKTSITRSIRELATLGHFDPEKLDVRPIPNPGDGTVDLTFIVEEKPNDQLEISGGWGQGMFVGTVGVRFSNFSMGRIFRKDAWSPIPSGDSQTLSIRAQTNGSYYKALSLSFVEPWLGGKKPTNLSFSVYHTIENYPGTLFLQRGAQSIKVSGGALGIGTRLKWPDDWFSFYNEFSYQHYSLDNWNNYFIFTDGKSNNFSYKAVFARNSISQPLYPRNGSNFMLSLQITPPYSLINGKDYKSITNPSEKYNWIEYHKWTGKAQWFQQLIGDLVLFTGAQFGYLGYYNKDIGYSPFEGFDVGGDGMSGYTLYGRETIGLRGYSNSSITPKHGSAQVANLYTKYTVELRFPAILQPQATVYVLGFLEAGNAWYEFRTFNPFNVHRSAGIGARLFLPMIGLLGVDWGYGFDAIPYSPGSNKGQFHFTIGQSF